MKISTYIPSYSKDFFGYENPFDIFVAELLLQFLRKDHEIVQLDEDADVNLIFNHAGSIRGDVQNIAIVDNSIIPLITLSPTADLVLEKFKKIDTIIYRSSSAQTWGNRCFSKKSKEFIIPGGADLKSVGDWHASVAFQKPCGDIICSDDDLWVYTGYLYPENGLRDSISYFFDNCIESSTLIVLGDPESIRWEIFDEMTDKYGPDADHKVIQLAHPTEIDVISAIAQCDKFINMSKLMYDPSIFYLASLLNKHIICSVNIEDQDILGNKFTILDKDFYPVLEKNDPSQGKDSMGIIENKFKHFLIEEVAERYVSSIYTALGSGGTR